MSRVRALDIRIGGLVHVRPSAMNGTIQGFERVKGEIATAVVYLLRTGATIKVPIADLETPH